MAVTTEKYRVGKQTGIVTHPFYFGKNFGSFWFISGVSRSMVEPRSFSRGQIKYKKIIELKKNSRPNKIFYLMN